MPTLVGSRKVRFSRGEVAAFNETWPASPLRDRAYWFQFDARGNLVDTDLPEQDDGPAAAALADDAKIWLEENL